MFKAYNNFGAEPINICFALVNEWIPGDHNKKYLKFFVYLYFSSIKEKLRHWVVYEVYTFFIPASAFTKVSNTLRYCTRKTFFKIFLNEYLFTAYQVVGCYQFLNPHIAKYYCAIQYFFLSDCFHCHPNDLHLILLNLKSIQSLLQL